MEEKHTNKYFYIISIIVALLVIGITISASFAFFTNSGSPTGTATVITSGSMSLELVDGDVVGITQGMLPGQKVQKKFKVRNTGTLETKYDIYLSEILNDFADKSDLVYRLISEDGGYNSSSDREVPSSVGSSSKIVPGTSIGANEEHNYILEIEFLNKPENQDDNKGKTFSAKIQINDYKEYVIATLDTGENVNIKLKQLANPELTNIGSWTNDENITSIQRANQLDNTKTTEIISSNESLKPVYAWYDNQTIYYYTEANTVALNDDSSRLFYHFINLNDIDIDSFEAPHLTNIAYMFSYNALTSIDLSAWDTSNVTSTHYIFENSPIEEINISGWDFTNNTDYSPIEQVTSSGSGSKVVKRIIARNLKGLNSMYYAFYNNSNLEYIDLTGTDTSKATSFMGMFKQNYLLKKIDGLDSLDTSNITNMSYVFYLCKALEEINLSSWNTSKVTDMNHMFTGAETLKVIDLSSFKTKKVTNMSTMFCECNNVETIYVGSGWNTSNATGGSLFNQNYKLVGGAGTVFDSSHYTIDYAHVDEGVSNPGYFTYKEYNYPTNPINENGYNYWNDGFSNVTYNSSSAPEDTYQNNSDLIGDKVYVRSTYVNSNPTRHDACIYYNNNEYCIEKGYWETKLGNVEETDENAEALGVYLKNDIETALEINNVNCLAGEFIGGAKTAVCVTSDEQVVVGAVYGGTVVTSSGNPMCIVNSDGSAYCAIY